jgi:hypothetical protein
MTNDSDSHSHDRSLSDGVIRKIFSGALQSDILRRGASYIFFSKCKTVMLIPSRLLWQKDRQ